MSKKIVSCAMAFLMAFTLMPYAAFAEEASAEGQAESLEAERPAEDDAFGEGVFRRGCGFSDWHTGGG